MEQVEEQQPESHKSSHLLLLFALLVLINLVVIVGNILVIVAVYATAKLRNVTNIFIVSLATADLLLGLFVLPYALTFEVSTSSILFAAHSAANERSSFSISQLAWVSNQRLCN